MMNEFMNKSVDKKYLLWTVFDEDENEDSGLNTFEIHEFRVCDCYLDRILYFQNKNKKTVFSEEFTTSFFDEIPSNNIASDVFPYLVKSLSFVVEEPCIIFSMRETFSMKNYLMNVWVMTLNAVVCIYSKRNCSFHIFVQIVNLIL